MSHNNIKPVYLDFLSKNLKSSDKYKDVQKIIGPKHNIPKLIAHNFTVQNYFFVILTPKYVVSKLITVQKFKHLIILVPKYVV